MSQCTIEHNQLVKDLTLGVKGWITIFGTGLVIIVSVIGFIGQGFIQNYKINNAVSVSEFEKEKIYNRQENENIKTSVLEIKATIKDLTTELRKTSESVANLNGKIDLLLRR
jgi:serine kinase of HPr protein (carbohydrate metabolism regulator)